MTRPIMLLILVACALTVYGAVPDDVAVVVDVSGSMKTYGPWQADARDAISALLAGRPLPAQWEENPRGADLSTYASINAHNHVTLVRFGSVRSTADYPYFDQIRGALSSAGLETEFPISPSDYTENRTNNALAEAVAITMIGSSGGSARVIMLSDFLADAKMSEQQLAFVNDTQGKYAKYTDATLSWVANPRVQIKLLRFIPLATVLPTGAAGAEMSSLHLSQPRYDEGSQSVLLAWTYQGSGIPEKYDVKVIDARRGTTLFSKYSLGGKNVTYPKAVSGAIRWSVTAYMQDGTTLEQSAAYNIPDSGGSPIALAILLIAVVAALAVGVLVVKKHGIPNFFERFRRRADTDI
jgi:hypothetical protein